MMEWAKRTDGVIFVAMTMLLLLLTATGHTPGRSASIVLLALGVVLFGLPHGALDPLVAQRALDMHSAMGLLLFVLGYALIAAMYGFVWRWSAPVGLATFLCISAFHFGTDWEQRGRLLTRCAYGLAIVTLPVLRHASETQHIYAVLSPAAAERLVQFSRIVALPAALAACLAAVVQWRERRSDLLELACIVAGALLLQPLLYFSCYFCFLHSPRHLLGTARAEGLTTAKAIAGAAAPATIAPVVFGCIFYFARSGPHALDESLLQIVFIGLAVLTVPHMLLQAVAHTGQRQRESGRHLAVGDA